MKPLRSGYYYHYNYTTCKLELGSSLLNCVDYDAIIIVSKDYNSNIIGTWNVKFKYRQHESSMY